jgi:protein-disulfide isomerase
MSFRRLLLASAAIALAAASAPPTAAAQGLNPGAANAASAPPTAAAQGLNPGAANAAPAPEPGVSPEIIDMMADAVIAKLKAKPEILLDIMLSYEERVRSGRSMIRPEDPVTGAADGDVIAVEFFDPTCVPCRTTAAAIDAVAAADPKLKVVHKDFPTTKEGMALSLDALGGRSYAEARKAILGGRTPAPADEAGRVKAAATLTKTRESAAKAEVKVLPTTFLVGAGRVERVEGPVDAAALTAKIAALRTAAAAAK